MHKKQTIFMALLTAAILIVIFIITGLTIKTVNKRVAEGCFDELEKNTVQLAGKLYGTAQMDKTILTSVAELITTEDDISDEKLCETMQAFNTDASFLSYIEVLRPDNTMLVSDGRVVDASDSLDFSKEAQKKEYISNVEQGIADNEEKVIRNAVPVIKDGKTVCVIYGVVKISDLEKKYTTDIYGGNAHVYLENGDTGELLLDTWHNSPADTENFASHDTIPGYSVQKAIEDMQNGLSGNIGIFSRSGERQYLHYEPTGINNWNVILSIEEKYAFRESSEISKSLYLMAICVGIVMLVFVTCVIVEIRFMIHNILNTQRELQSNRAMLSLAMKNAKVHAWRYDSRIKTITDSNSLGEAFNLPKTLVDVPESVLRDGYIHSDSFEEFRRLYAEADKHKLAVGEIHATLDNGKTYIWIREILKPVFDSNGNYIETIGSSIDVTEQKERENDFKERLRIKQLLLPNSVAMAHYNLTKNKITNIEGIHANRLKIKETDTADDILKSISEFAAYKGGDKIDDVCNHNDLIKMYYEGKTHFSVTHHIKNDGHYYESTFDLMKNPDTNDIEAIAMLNDVTEYVVAKEVVTTLTRVDYEMILSIDAQTGESHLLSAENADLQVGDRKKPWDEYGSVEAHLRKFCCDADVERVVKETSIPNVKEQLKNRQVVTVTYSLRLDEEVTRKRVIFTYLDSSETIILCAIQDLTETYRQEEEQKRQLAAALSAAESANKAKSEFFSRMSHDMRTPMNGILGLAELSENEDDIAVLKRNIVKIKETGGYLLSLINDTLDLQKIESGKIELDYHVVNVKDEFENMMDIIRPMIIQKKHILHFSSDFEKMDLYIRADAVRVKQLLINLLSNAIKYTPEHGDISIGYRSLGRDGNIAHTCISITDTGVGMSEDFLSNGLYKPYSQEHSRMTNQLAGTGLGLSIVKTMVEKMGGSIEIKSKLGVGTEVDVYLDFEMVDISEIRKTAEENTKLQNDITKILNGKKILLVEDDELGMEIARELLENVGCTVVCAGNGKIAVDKLAVSQNGDFDAVLMDMYMPVMDGIEATKQIRAFSDKDVNRVPIIAMTANAYEDDIQATKAAGMNFHLTKPIDSVTLFETLAEFCNQK